jgi:O-antigen/teichoic acid export membrane protein
MFRAAALLMAGRVVAFVATFLAPVVLVRLFEPGEFGTYRQLFLVFGTLYPIAQLGMAESLFYFLPGADEAAGRYVANSVGLLGLAGLASVLALEAVGADVAGWLGNSALVDYLAPLGAFAALTLAAAGLEIVLTARGCYGWAALSYGISDAARAAALVLPALVFRSLEAVLVGVVLFALLRFLAALAYFARTFRSTFRLDAALLARQLAYAGPFAFAVVLEIAQANFHQYAVAHRFDAATFAVYAIGCLQIPFVDFVISSAGNVMMVRLAEARQAGRADLALATWLDATRKVALIFCPLVAGLLVGARELVVVLFTERYVGAVPVFAVSTLTIGLAALMTDGVLRAYAQTRFLVLLNAVRLGLVAALVVPCIAVLGLPGAMLATVVTTAVAKVLALARIKRLLGVGLAQFLPWRSLRGIVAMSAVAGLAGLAVKWPLAEAPLATLAASTLTTAAVYGALLVRGGVLSEDERLVLGGWLRRVSGRALETVRPGG